LRIALPLLPGLLSRLLPLALFLLALPLSLLFFFAGILFLLSHFVVSVGDFPPGR
jgi:hypothetical protein